MARFYGHFAAAYGTCWLAIVILAIITHSSIQTGAFGLIGFPAIGILYALIRIAIARNTDYQIRRLQERISRLERERQANAGI